MQNAGGIVGVYRVRKYPNPSLANSAQASAQREGRRTSQNFESEYPGSLSDAVGIEK
jgi:hypothetical protein